MIWAEGHGVGTETRIPHRMVLLENWGFEFKLAMQPAICNNIHQAPREVKEKILRLHDRMRLNLCLIHLVHMIMGGAFCVPAHR